MKLKATRLAIPDVILLEPARHRDHRGFFSETYSKRALSDAGIGVDFVQDNHSLSRERGVVRGLHFQTAPTPQDKLVRVPRGAVFDVAVDLRHGSPTFGKWVGAILSGENWHQLFVPKGFAHGFCTLEPDSELLYKVSDYYAPECDRGVAWDDPDIGIDWPIKPEEAVLSEKDAKQPRLKALPAYFKI
jgi:dTDP-4-dehydrorhamnose 3,5-epimerase